MTNEVVIKKLIEKAVDNGWLPKLNDGLLQKDFITFLDDRIILSGAFIQYTFRTKQQILLDPDFAKALWGDNPTVTVDGVYAIPNDVKFLPAWQYHQHQLLDEIQAGRDIWKFLKQFV